MFYLYILHSPTVKKFYIGFTGDDLSERIRRHNSHHKGFTGQADDWELAYREAFPTKVEAAARERQIKRWKSQQRIQELIERNKP